MTGSIPGKRGPQSDLFEPMAAKCRRLADAISDGPTREALLQLAKDYESLAPDAAATRTRER